MRSLPRRASTAPSIRMPEQLLLPGFQVAPPTDGLFLGILPETSPAETIAECARALSAQHALRGRPLAVDRLHFSLHDLSLYFDSGIDLVARITEAAATLQTPPFEVTLDRVLSFRRNQPEQALVLRSSTELKPLHDFHRDLGIALRKTGLGLRLHHAFTPHVTLLYDPKRIAEQSVTPITWTVKAFALIHSLRGQSHYIIRGHWLLCG